MPGLPELGPGDLRLFRTPLGKEFFGRIGPQGSQQEKKKFPEGPPKVVSKYTNFSEGCGRRLLYVSSFCCLVICQVFGVYGISVGPLPPRDVHGYLGPGSRPSRPVAIAA